MTSAQQNRSWHLSDLHFSVKTILTNGFENITLRFENTTLGFENITLSV